MLTVEAGSLVEGGVLNRNKNIRKRRWRAEGRHRLTGGRVELRHQ